MSTQVVPRANDSFIGEPGAILNGAVDISALFVRSGTSSGRPWGAAGQMEQETLLKGTCDSPAFTGCKYAHDVYFDNRPLARVMSLSELRSGRFFFDYSAHAIFLADDPRGHGVEVAISPGAFQGWQTSGSSVTVRGLAIQKFANQAQAGAVNCGVGWTVEDNDISLNHGTGLKNCDVVRHNAIHDNGQLGIGGGKLIEYNELANNNTARFSGRWEAGGAKFVLTNGLVVRGNYVHDNDGPGLWSDIDNIHTTYEGNYVSHNSLEGIVDEISYDSLIKDNVVVNNGFGTRSGWLDGAGILVASSPNADVVGNLVANNWNGIGVTQTARGSGLYGPHEVHDVRVHDNRISMGRGQTGMAQGVNDPSYFFTRNNSFSHNTYYLGCIDYPFAWRSPSSRALDGKLTTGQWGSVGNDRDGLIVSTCGG